MLFRLLALSMMIVLLAATPAHATRTVTSATVSEGDTVVEAKGEYTVDGDDDRDGAWKNKMTVSHGFTSWWSSEIETNVEHSGNPDDRTDFTNIDWKNKFQLTSQAESGVDTGFRISYGRNFSGSDDKVELKLLAGKDIGPTAHRANIIIDRTTGGEKGVNWGLSWSSRYKQSESFQPGIEIYNSFGRLGHEDEFESQDHRAGPVFYGKLNDRLSYDAGYLIGLSNHAPDGTVKVILKYKLP